MKNSMEKAMAERYADYFKTTELEERAAKNLYYWVMSTIESIFWGLGRKASLWIRLYATEKKTFLVYRHPTGKDYEFEYHSTHNCSGEKILIIVERFAEILNDYSDSNIMEEAPVIKLFGNRIKQGEEGYEIAIYIDMRPSANNETENHGRH